MYLGERKVRSAGRLSGSVEITLPVEVAVLEGIPCRLHLRDGLAPEIVLEPDLRGAAPLFERLWDLLRAGLEEIDEIGDFAEADYGFGLFRSTKLGVLPSLAYADALVIQRDIDNALGSPGEPKPQALEAFAHIVESMAAVAGKRLGLTSELAAMFGNQVAYLVSGEAIGARDAFARNLGPSVAAGPGEPGWCRSSPLSVDKWRGARGSLTGVYEQFRSWGREPTLFARERQHWYRARHFEARLRAAGV